MQNLPYSKQWVDEDDIAAVSQALQSDWLTTGPRVEQFEQAIAQFVGAREAVAVANGTAALHAMMHALDIGPGDDVLVPAVTFAASANCVVFQGGNPVFVDVDPDTLLIDPRSVAERITARTRAIIAVDFAGQPCDYDAIRQVIGGRSISLVADACHSLGARSGDQPVGNLATMSAFSFHPVKPMTTAEGGVVTVHDSELARRMRTFRNHGITTDHRQRNEQGTWQYDMVTLGYNYRLSDLHCALGLSQLPKLPAWTNRRQAIAAKYDEAFRAISGVEPLKTRPGAASAHHLYVVRLEPSLDRNRVFTLLRERGIGVNVHYQPVHLLSFYRERFGTGPGLCPRAERECERILSLPIFPQMTDDDVDRVVSELRNIATTASSLRRSA